jgi:hypothetical protein
MNFHDYHILKILFFIYIIGPHAPKKINIYNKVIINELVQLHKQGIPIFNASTQAREHINVGVMFMVGDVPGIGKEQNRVQQNAKTSCSHCYAEGKQMKQPIKTNPEL